MALSSYHKLDNSLSFTLHKNHSIRCKRYIFKDINVYQQNCDEQTDGKGTDAKETDGQKDGQTDGRTDRRTNERTDGWTDRQSDQNPTETLVEAPLLPYGEMLKRR